MRALPSTGGRARAAGGGGALQQEEEDGFGARRLVPQSHLESGMLFNAPFTDARFLLVSSINSRSRELQGVVDDLYDAQVMDHPEERIRMLQRWLKALYEGGDRAIARIRHDWGEPPLPAVDASAPPLVGSAVGDAGGLLSGAALAEYEARRDANRSSKRAARAGISVAEYEAQRDADREARSAVQANSQDVNVTGPTRWPATVPDEAAAGGGRSLASPRHDEQFAASLVAEENSSFSPPKRKERKVYPKGVWDVSAFQRAQVRRELPSLPAPVQDRVAAIFHRERVLEREAVHAGLRPVFMSLAQILREAGAYQEDDSSPDEELGETAPPPSGPGQRSSMTQEMFEEGVRPSSPNYSPSRP